MPRRVPRILFRNENVRVWPFVLAAMLAMSGAVFVAAKARSDADRSRRAQALVERIRARSQQLAALRADAVLEVRTGDTPIVVQLPAITARGVGIYRDLNRTLQELRHDAPGPRADQLGADVRQMYRAGIQILGEAMVSGSGRGGAERFAPLIQRLDDHLQAASGEQAKLADRASRRAAIAFYGAIGGGLLALLVLTMWLEHARRRWTLAEHVREVERRSEERIRALVEHASDVVTVVGQDLVVRWQAASVRRMLGVDPEAAIGQPLMSLVHPDDVTRLQGALARCAGDGTIRTIAVRLRHTDGSWVHAEVVASNRLADRAVQGLLLSIRDVGERKVLEERLRHQAYHDPLTGLANRALFEERLAAALDAAERVGRGVAVLFLDLDDFKNINDSLGHAAGDELLRTVATRIAGVLRPEDLASRQGGDEFAVLLDDVADERGAVAVAERVAEALRPELMVDGRPLAISASIGLVLGWGGTTVEELLRNADIAMYKAKEDGKAGIRVFEEALHRRAVDRLELGAELPRAIESGELVLDFQPIVELDDGRIAGVEALVRWEHPERGRLAPGQFIALAEQTGAIVALGLWVLRSACRTVRALQLRTAGRGEPLYVSVNVSTKQLRDPRFPEAVARILQETRLPPGSLVLELTESLLVDDRDSIMVQLLALKALGLRLAVDDFGTGYSVLSYLQEFPIDLLKIDKSFVDDIHLHPEKAKLVAGIVQLSDSLHLEVIAEGIEESAQAEQLRAMRSPLGQGYLFSRPVPAEEIERLLAAEAGEPSGAGDAPAAGERAAA